MPGHGLLLLSAETEEDFEGWLKDLSEIAIDAQKKRETESESKKRNKKSATITYSLSLVSAVAVAAAVASAKKKSLRGWLHSSHSHQPSAIALAQAAGMNGSSTSQVREASLTVLFRSQTSSDRVCSIYQVLASSIARQSSRRVSSRRKITDIFPGVDKSESESFWQ